MKDCFNNDLTNLDCLFHGSPKKLVIIEPREAHDSNGNAENEDTAVFLTSSFLLASAYAFKDSIKELSDGLDWDFDFNYDPDTKDINIIFSNVKINDDIEGYVYTVPYSENYEHHGRSIQYKCHKKIKPTDVVKIKFGDYKKYYQINGSKTK